MGSYDKALYTDAEDLDQAKLPEPLSSPNDLPILIRLRHSAHEDESRLTVLHLPKNTLQPKGSRTSESHTGRPYGLGWLLG